MHSVLLIFISLSGRNEYPDIVIMEAAGLALGILPLLIEGVTIYMSSTEKVIEMIRHKRTLNMFRRELETEKSIFNNMLYKISCTAGVTVEANVGFSPEILKEVLSCLHLHSDAVKSFGDCCQELNTILKELMQKFETYDEDRVGIIALVARLYH